MRDPDKTGRSAASRELAARFAAAMKTQSKSNDNAEGMDTPTTIEWLREAARALWREIETPGHHYDQYECCDSCGKDGREAGPWYYTEDPVYRVVCEDCYAEITYVEEFGSLEGFCE